MTEEKKTQWCYSVNEENYHGQYDSIEEAHGEAHSHLHNDMEIGDVQTYWIAEVAPAHEFLAPQRLGEWIEEHVDESLGDDIGWDDHLVELKPTEREELGRMVIDYLRKANAFRAYGVKKVAEHTYVKTEE